MSKKVVKTIVVLLLFGFLFNLLAFGVDDVETPVISGGEIGKFWEPFNYEFGDYNANNLIEKLQVENSEWTVTRYLDDTDDDEIGDCTRENCDSLASDSGITFIFTHGSTDGVGTTRLVLAECSDSDTIDDWRGSTSSLTRLSLPPESPTEYKVLADTDYCEGNWKTLHDDNKSFVLIIACGASNFMDSVGGSTQIGYTEPFGVASALNDVADVFKRMNGDEGSGEFRIASEAISDANSLSLFSEYFTYSGGNITLAPAPLYEDPVSPTGAGAGGSGSGYVEFDTKMDTTIDAEEALTWVCNSGDAEISDIEWDGDFKIIFDYQNLSCPAPYEIEMTANEAKCTSCSGGIRLNGDRIDGNEDDYVWIFSD
ncbi:MAG: hypothetical protein K9M75_02505 [Phycisphaerae bacterium]|nr:hypothetical protein [Phycisphaerae bacterium]